MPTTIVTQIQHLEDELRSCQQRLDTIQYSLRHRDTSEEERKQLEVESRELGVAVEDHRKQLSALRKENRKTMVVSVAIMALLGLLYYAFTITSS